MVFAGLHIKMSLNRETEDLSPFSGHSSGRRLLIRTGKALSCRKHPASSGQQQRVLETAMALLLVSVLIAATVWVLLPFVGILTYAVILATATAELFDRLVDLLGKRRRLAAVLFGAIAATITIVPLIYLSFLRSRPRGCRRSVAERRRQSRNPRPARLDCESSAGWREGDAGMAGAAARWSGRVEAIPTPARRRWTLALEPERWSCGCDPRDFLGRSSGRNDSCLACPGSALRLRRYRAHSRSERGQSCWMPRARP